MNEEVSLVECMKVLVSVEDLKVDGVRVLIVEDMVLALKEVEAELLSMGLRTENIHLCKNSTSLNEFLEESFSKNGEQNFEPHIVFMDGELEKDRKTDKRFNTSEALKIIQEKASQALIISISGQPDQSKEFKLPHISKPFQQNAITSAVKDFLDGKKINQDWKPY